MCGVSYDLGKILFWTLVLCRFCKLDTSTYMFFIWTPKPTKKQHFKHFLGE